VKRALGIPEPFVWLCHCLSGGLPRDLGRVAIALHDLKDKHSRIDDFTRALVRQDLAMDRFNVNSDLRGVLTLPDQPDV
ncbi:DUF3131 domain-containing protein, partial [Saccharothrix sp. MB29]|nr:DUF3131 domain-containing protein [Saccharothrix sp. MB29]